MFSESIISYCYLVLTAQVTAKSSIIGSDASNITARTIFMDKFRLWCDRNFNTSLDIQMFQKVLDYASTPVNYSLGKNLYMIPSDMNLRIGFVEGLNNKTLVSMYAYVGVVHSSNKSVDDMFKIGTDKEDLIARRLQKTIDEINSRGGLRTDPDKYSDAMEELARIKDKLPATVKKSVDILVKSNAVTEKSDKNMLKDKSKKVKEEVIDRYLCSLPDIEQTPLKQPLLSYMAIKTDAIVM